MMPAPALSTLREATLPAERRGIARDAVRMLVTNRSANEHEDRRFFDLPKVLRPGDLLVANDSATLPAALTATRNDGTPLLLHVGTELGTSLRIVEPRGEIDAGEHLDLGDGAGVTLLAPLDKRYPRLWYARFDVPFPVHAFLAKAGAPIRYAYITERLPLADYQTLFARVPGSSEMPSAGRPFTEATIRALRRRDIAITTITLHCGISSLEAPEHPGPERYVVSPATAALVNATRREGRRVIAVGTTVVRALETSVFANEVVASSGWTEHVIDPEHAPRVIDGLLSGFHHPTATHVELLAAFVPRNVLRTAYERAAEQDYLCHEFGDVHLIL
jgi:S-adenosylmethionine:tRNA ribosyltransferase-isomerase